MGSEAGSQSMAEYSAPYACPDRSISNYSLRLSRRYMAILIVEQEFIAVFPFFQVIPHCLPEFQGHNNLPIFVALTAPQYAEPLVRINVIPLQRDSLADSQSRAI